MSSRRQKIIDRLEALGAQPKRSLGQNFLISDHVVDAILASALSEPYTDLIEVGPGLGAITDDLMKLSPQMRVIELDRAFAEMWRDRGLHVVEADALVIDWRQLELRSGSLLVSNLPYQISSSLVIERSLQPAGLTRMVLMFQKEVAQRLAASPRTKEYGLLSVIAQTFWRIRKVVDAGPGCFLPPPKVSSRVMAFGRKTDEELAGLDDGFLGFAKAAFSQRRKLLSRNLFGSYFGGRDGALAQIEALLADHGILKTARAEELDPEAFVRLYFAARELKGQKA